MLAANPLCCLCEVEGRVRAASIVDHFKPLEQLTHDDEAACWTLCAPCHDAKTSYERGAHAVGEDGWPAPRLSDAQIRELERRIAAYEATR